MSGSVCSGNATDYRAALELLWTAQAADRQEKAPQWPNRTLTNDEKTPKERPQLRLPMIEQMVFTSGGLNRRLSCSDASNGRISLQKIKEFLPDFAASADGAPRTDGSKGGDSDAEDQGFGSPGIMSPVRSDDEASEAPDAHDPLPPLETVGSSAPQTVVDPRPGRKSFHKGTLVLAGQSGQR